MTDLSIFVLNLATMLGLGLAIDYSLFITSRFREEIPRSASTEAAVARTMATAGRAIFFSGLTVLIGLSGLILFDFMFLRSVGIAGVVVVFLFRYRRLDIAPPILGIAGPNIERFSLFRRLPEPAPPRRILGHVVAMGDEAAGDGVAADHCAPDRIRARVRHVNISSPDATILPTSTESRQGFDVLVDAYGPGEISADRSGLPGADVRFRSRQCAGSA